MIRSFYKYARNQYLGDSLNNFVCEKSIWMSFICGSISIKVEYYTDKWEGWTPIQFSQLTHTNHLLCFI